MRPQVVGPARGPWSSGLVERLLVIGIGLLAMLAIHFAPLEGLRVGQSSGTAAQAAPTAVSTPAPTAAPATAVPSAAATPDPEAAAPAGPAPAAAPGAPGSADAPGFRVVAGGDGANIRSAPSQSAPVVVSVRDGTLLADLNEARTAEGLQWQHVGDGNVEGWIAAELVTPVQ
ncbi:MAG TPA: SH3 domain-containing protein [Chloroflexota bacterium]|jgi:hypothetical protein